MTKRGFRARRGENPNAISPIPKDYDPYAPVAESVMARPGYLFRVNTTADGKGGHPGYEAFAKALRRAAKESKKKAPAFVQPFERMVAGEVNGARFDVKIGRLALEWLRKVPGWVADDQGHYPFAVLRGGGDQFEGLEPVRFILQKVDLAPVLNPWYDDPLVTATRWAVSEAQMRAERGDPPKGRTGFSTYKLMGQEGPPTVEQGRGITPKDESGLTVLSTKGDLRQIKELTGIYWGEGRHPVTGKLVHQYVLVGHFLLAVRPTEIWSLTPYKEGPDVVIATTKADPMVTAPAAGGVASTTANPSVKTDGPEAEADSADIPNVIQEEEASEADQVLQETDDEGGGDA